MRRAAPLDVGLEAQAGDLDELRDNLEDADGAPDARVPRATAQLRTIERARDREVGGDGVLGVEEVALHQPIGADYRPLAREQRADRAGDQPREVEVAAAEDVAKARHRYGQPEGMRVGAGDDVGAGLGGVVGVVGL